MSPAAVKSDFVNVRLTAAGAAHAGQPGTVRVANGHFDYTFTADTPVRVLTSEWNKLFSKRVVDGAPVFETVPGTDSAAPAKSKKPSLTELKAQEAQLENQIAADVAAGDK